MMMMHTFFGMAEEAFSHSTPSNLRWDRYNYLVHIYSASKIEHIGASPNPTSSLLVAGGTAQQQA